MSCPMCNSDAVSFLGKLGRLIWNRCRSCGWEWSEEPEDVKEPHNEGLQSTALFGVGVWNPLDAGIKGVPMMVPAHEYNRVASNLADALSLALQYVPIEGTDAEEIRKLERAATIPPNKG